MLDKWKAGVYDVSVALGINVLVSGIEFLRWIVFETDLVGQGNARTAREARLGHDYILLALSMMRKAWLK